MPRIVPLQLLKCLRVLLDTNGGILSAAEVKRIAGLMTKYSKKLVSKCVYVQILKSTKTELLGDFMTVGGWGLVCTWLSDAIRTMNWPLVQEILELLLLSPVDVNRLKINSAPILVKGLCKDGGNEGVRILAKRLVEQWLKIVTENPSCATTNSSPAGAVEPKENSAGSADSVSNMEHSSSDSTDSGGGGPVTQNYTIASGERKRNLVITIKTVDKSATAAASADSLYNDDDSSLPPTEAGAETSGSIESSERSILDDSSTTRELKSGEDADVDANGDKKHKSPRDKSKRSEKDRDRQDRKSSSSSGHRSSSSSHKSSSSSSSSSKNSSSKSSSSSSHRSSSDKHRDKDNKSRSSSSSSSSKDKDRKDGLGSSSSSSSSSKHKSSKSSSSSSSSSSKDRTREKEKDKSSSSGSKKEHEKDSKMMPPPPVASDKKPKDGGEVEVQKPKSISIPSRKASISIEIRRDTEKTATVKTYQSKFRSHGLTEEAPPPPSRKGLKKPTSTVPPPSVATHTTPLSLKRASPPPRDSVPVEKKTKIDINNVSGHVDRPGSVKLIAPKKIQTLVETNLFSDALAASIEPKKTAKKKIMKMASPSPTEKDAPLAPLKFYQDTLDESKSEDKSDDSAKENDDSRTGSPGKDMDIDDDDIPLNKVKEDIEQKVQKEKAAEGGDASSDVEMDDTPEEPKKPGPGCGPNGPPGVLMLHRRKGPKKKLTWQPEDKLTQIRYFEVDRSERVNVTKQSFLEMKNMERYSERDALNISRRGFDDNMEPQMEWRPLIEVANVPDHPNGSASKQRVVQAEREATTLRALYFSPDMIPDSAAEAELEPHFQHDIPVIPIDDLTGNPDAVNDYSTLPWPEPKGYGAASSSEIGFGVDSINTGVMPPGLNPNLMATNPFQPYGNNFMPNPNPQMPMNMQQPPTGPPPIWQNQMQGSPMMNPMNGPGPGPGMPDMPPNFIGNPGPFGSPGGPFGGPPGFNNMNYPPMMMNGPGGGPMPGPGPNGPMMNGPMPNGMTGPMTNGGPRNNNRKNNGGNGGNWRIGGNNFQDNSGGNWRSAGSGSNRGGGGGGGNNNNNTGICKQFMRGHCHMGKSCKYIHPQKKRM